MLGSIYTNKSRFELNISTNNRPGLDNMLSPVHLQNIHSAVPKLHNSSKNDLLGGYDDENGLFKRNTDVMEEEDEDKEDDKISEEDQIEEDNEEGEEETETNGEENNQNDETEEHQ